MQFVNDKSTAFWYVLIISFFIFLPCKAWATPSLMVISKDGLISLEAKEVKVEEIFKEISKKCSIEIKNYGNVFPPNPINLTFSDLELKEGIKKIIKVAGIKNYSLLYKEVKPELYKIDAIDFLGEGKASMGEKSNLERPSRTTIQKQINRDPKAGEEALDKDFEERVTDFKNRYEWVSNDTKELAGYLLKKMPDQVKEDGLAETIMGLDEMIKKEGKDKVDEEMFVKAMEGTVPPQMAPKMTSYIKKYIKEFKGQ